jgi:cytochrome c-type biogenesis protein CcmH/NrfG
MDYFSLVQQIPAMAETQGSGLPPRIYLPIVGVLVIAFLTVMFYLVSIGFGVSGSVFGKSAAAGTPAPNQAQSGTNVQGGGPPAAVFEQLTALRARVAANPRDDVAITQLADMYLAANKFGESIPLYKRALAINPGNVAAQAGLEQAQESLK